MEIRCTQPQGALASPFPTMLRIQCNRQSPAEIPSALNVLHIPVHRVPEQFEFQSVRELPCEQAPASELLVLPANLAASRWESRQAARSNPAEKAYVEAMGGWYVRLIRARSC